MAFDPSQLRAANGRWIRMGRGDLEELLRVAVRGRAEHIASTNNKGGDEAHIKRVQADISRKVLGGVKVAPVYNVRVTRADTVRMPRDGVILGDLVKEGGDINVDIGVAGTEARAVRAIIPVRKAHGNVRTTNLPRGEMPRASEILNRAQLSAEAKAGPDSVRTENVHKELVAALPSGIPVSAKAKLGLTGVAKGAAKAKREARRKNVPDTEPEGPKALLRRAQAYAADKELIFKPAELKVLERYLKSKPMNIDETHLTYVRRLIGGAKRKPDMEAMGHLLGNLMRDDVGRDSSHAGGQAEEPGAPVSGAVKVQAGHIVVGVRYFHNGRWREVVEVKPRSANQVFLRMAGAAGKFLDADRKVWVLPRASKLARDAAKRNPLEKAYDALADARAHRRRVPPHEHERRRQARARVQEAKAAVLRLGGNPANPKAHPGPEARGRAVGQGFNDAQARRDLGVGASTAKGLPDPASKISAMPAPGELEQLGIDNVRSLHGGPGHLNEVKLADLASGHQVVIKPEAGIRAGRVRDVITPGGDFIREEAAFWIAQHLGTPTPPIVQRDVPGEGNAVVSAFIPGAKTMYEYMRDGRQPHGEKIARDERSIALLDMVIGNTDRHAGNYMSDGERLYAIDHGLAFPDVKARGHVFGNFKLSDKFLSKSLTSDEIDRLRAIQDAWPQLAAKMAAGGMEEEAISYAKLRVDRMIERGKFLKHNHELMGALR
jgi:hypothetical protein